MTAFAKLSVDSVFETLGVDAVLAPEGTATAAKVLASRGDTDAQYNGLDIVDQGGMYEIRVEDWADNANGTQIQIGSQLRRVQSFKILDDHRLKVMLNTVEVS